MADGEGADEGLLDLADEDFALWTQAEHTVRRAQSGNSRRAALMRLRQLLGVPEQGPESAGDVITSSAAVRVASAARCFMMSAVRSTVQQADAIQPLSASPAPSQIPIPFQPRAPPRTPAPDLARYGSAPVNASEARFTRTTHAAPEAPNRYSPRHELLQQQRRPAFQEMEHPIPASGLTTRPELRQQQLRPTLRAVGHLTTPASGSAARPVHTIPAAPKAAVDLQQRREAFGRGRSPNYTDRTTEVRRGRPAATAVAQSEPLAAEPREVSFDSIARLEARSGITLAYALQRAASVQLAAREATLAANSLMTAAQAVTEADAVALAANAATRPSGALLTPPMRQHVTATRAPVALASKGGKDVGKGGWGRLGMTASAPEGAERWTHITTPGVSNSLSSANVTSTAVHDDRRAGTAMPDVSDSLAPADLDREIVDGEIFSL